MRTVHTIALEALSHLLRRPEALAAAARDAAVLDAALGKKRTCELWAPAFVAHDGCRLWAANDAGGWGEHLGRLLALDLHALGKIHESHRIVCARGHPARLPSGDLRLSNAGAPGDLRLRQRGAEPQDHILDRGHASALSTSALFFQAELHYPLVHSRNMDGSDLFGRLLDKRGLNPNSLAAAIKNPKAQSTFHRFREGVTKQPKRESLEEAAAVLGVNVLAFYDPLLADREWARIAGGAAFDDDDILTATVEHVPSIGVTIKHLAALLRPMSTMDRMSVAALVTRVIDNPDLADEAAVTAEKIVPR